MKIKEVREIDSKGLVEKLENAQNKLTQLKLTHAVSPLENPSEIKMIRRDIARIKTVLRERELNK
ncbi:MAG: 50S ribosomal protein L29 [Prevotella sp.]